MTPDQITAFTALLSFVSCALLLYLLRKPAISFGLTDKPDMERKMHHGEIPLIGGICLYLALCSTLVLPAVNNPENFYIYVSVLFVTGLVDDLKGLRVRTRVVIQLAVALFVCLLDDHLITFVGDIIGIGNIGTNMLAVPITVVAIVTAINAFNMIDGIDGLAASIAMVSFASLGIIFFDREMWLPFHLCIAFVAALIPFLVCNLKLWPYKHKAFLGDAGSIVIGFAIVWLLIAGSQPSDRADPVSRAFYPVTALWIVGLPLFDLMSVSIRRMLNRSSPFEGDRDHIHHILLQHGISPGTCLAICCFLEILLSLIGMLFDFAQMEAISFYVFWCAFAIYYLLTTHFSRQSSFRIG